MKITEKIEDFVRLSPEKKHYMFQEVWNFDQEIFPRSCIDDLYDYLHDGDAKAIPIVRYYANGQLIGQNIIRILQLSLDGERILVVNSRAGFLSKYRGRNLSLYSAIRVVLQHKLKHPSVPFWFVPTIMQPKVYMLFASRTANFYPRANQPMPEKYQHVLNLIIDRKKQVQQRAEGVYIHPSDLPKVDSEHLIRLRNNAETHVNFFMQHVPDYFDGLGMLCVCELDLKTIVETAMNLAFDRHLN